jgi:D-amino-acid dehydrogenase
LSALAAPLARYWWASAPARHETAIRGHSALIAHALAAHEELMAECSVEALVRHHGYHWVYRSAAALEAAAEEARALQQRFGVRHAVRDERELARAEPGLHGRLAGAIHWPDPLTVADPGALVTAYARRFQALGGSCLVGDASTFEPEGEGWRVTTNEGLVQARNAVVALGPWSNQLVRRLGYRLPLFVKRGYHRHFTGGPGLQAPLLDAERGYVLAPMVQGVRLTTGAEFARLGRPATSVQMERATLAARELLTLPQEVESRPWLGNRPCTPDMLPVLGAAPRHRGLWFNFGHAHQGFTLGPVCGRLMAELIEGGKTLVDIAPYAPDRF